MSIILVSNILLSPKWLIIEPRSPQSLKTIYHVLKFAAKHKAALNRSALTYWEEDIPSRIDLGKSKYGGPFTTEQVEDVKTILHLLAISLPFSVVTISSILPGSGDVFGKVNIRLFSFFDDRKPGLNACITDIVHFFIYSIFLYGVLGSVIHEFLIYPFIRNRLPSILRRIGTVSLLVTFSSFVCFSLKLVHYLFHSNETVTEWIAQILQQLTRGALTQSLLTLILQFMCAQSPYNMRGLLLSIVALLVIASCGIQIIPGVFFIAKNCRQPWCPLISYSVKTIICFIGFLLFYVVARWYKKRVRDDNYSTQQVVEEVYDRYLTAAATHSRSCIRYKQEIDSS